MESLEKLEKMSAELMKQYDELKKDGSTNQSILLEIKNEYLVNEIDITQIKIQDKMDKQKICSDLIEENKRVVEEGNFFASGKAKIALAFHQSEFDTRQTKLNALNEQLSKDKGYLNDI